jgi:hypothetical protein
MSCKINRVQPAHRPVTFFGAIAAWLFRKDALPHAMARVRSYCFAAAGGLSAKNRVWKCCQDSAFMQAREFSLEAGFSAKTLTAEWIGS